MPTPFTPVPISCDHVCARVTSVMSLGGGTSLPPWSLAAIAASIFAAAILRGFTGFGFSLAAVPLLSLVLAPVQAVPLAIGLQLCAGLADFTDARRACHWPSVCWLVAGAVLGTPFGAAALVAASPNAARIAIAGICGFGTFLLTRGYSFGRLPGAAATMAVGLTAGLFNGLAAAPGPPVVAYYLASPLAPAQSRASLLVFFLVTSILGLASVSVAGLVHPGLLVPVLIGLPLMIFGSRWGRLLFERVGGRGHRAVSVGILAFVAAIGGLKAMAELM